MTAAQGSVAGGAAIGSAASAAGVSVGTSDEIVALKK